MNYLFGSSLPKVDEELKLKDILNKSKDAFTQLEVQEKQIKEQLDVVETEKNISYDSYYNKLCATLRSRNPHEKEIVDGIMNEAKTLHEVNIAKYDDLYNKLNKIRSEQFDLTIVIKKQEEEVLALQITEKAKVEQKEVPTIPITPTPVAVKKELEIPPPPTKKNTVNIIESYGKKKEAFVFL